MILTATSRIEGNAILRHHDLVTGEAIVGGNVLEERHRAPRRSARRPARSRTTSSAHSRPRLPALERLSGANRHATGHPPQGAHPAARRQRRRARTRRRASIEIRATAGRTSPGNSPGPPSSTLLGRPHRAAHIFKGLASTRRVQCPRTPAHRAVLASSTTHSPTAPSPPRPPSATPRGMILTTTSGIEGRRILLYHDLVIGEAIVGAGRRATRFNRRHCDTRHGSSNAPSQTDRPLAARAGWGRSRRTTAPSTTPTTNQGRTEQYSSPERAGRAAIRRPFARTSDSTPYPPRRPSPDRRRVWRARKPASTRRVQRSREPTSTRRVKRPGRRAAAQPATTAPRTGWRHATDGRANAPETVSFPRARTHGCRLRRKGIRNSRKSCARPGTKRACASNSLCGTEKYTSRYPHPDPARIRQPATASFNHVEPED